jgi:F0F1-type ATP synthase assembly protein I
MDEDLSFCFFSAHGGTVDAHLGSMSFVLDSHVLLLLVFCFRDRFGHDRICSVFPHFPSL